MGKRVKSSSKSNIAREKEINEGEEVAILQARIAEESPAPGTQATAAADLRFDSYPLSKQTRAGLKVCKYSHPTDIQAAAIPHALAGRDILGAAKTGSGKTLSYVLPVLEKLFLERWGIEDGLGAIIIVPTRELGLQVFEVLRTVGRQHNLSAGLITGGKKEFEEEQQRVVRMNILIATPGRLLQHFEQTPGFEAGNLQMLVLDEADRVLDMGFKQQLDSILDYLPSRQTLLFSATQTKSVKDLARLSLRGAEYLAVHANEESVTPKMLTQHYVTCTLPEKLDVLFSFLRTHVKNKTIVFFSTCAQCRYVFDIFRAMQPGVPLVALHGKIKQDRRTIIYMDFLKRPQACMFATDVAARGLDFPSIDWVVQVDPPEDTDMYIHRVGRTARYNAKGRSLLLLMPQEERALCKELSDAAIPIKKLTVNKRHTVSVAGKAAALLAAKPELRQLAKKAFVSFLRSLVLTPTRLSLYVNKETGTLAAAPDSSPPSGGDAGGGGGGVNAFRGGSRSAPGTGLPLDDFATALGLPFTPDAPAVPDASALEATKKKKNVNRSLDKLKKQIKEEKEARRAAKGLATGASTRTKNGASTEGSGNTSESESDSDSNDDFLVVKKTHRPGGNDDDGSGDGGGGDSSDTDEIQLAPSIGRNAKKKPLKIDSDGQAKATSRNKRTLFGEDGEALEGLKMREGGAGRVDLDRIEDHARRVKARIDQGRGEDAQRERDRIREKHLKAKAAARGHDDEDDQRGGGVVLGGMNESGDDGSESESESDVAPSSDDDDDGDDDDGDDDEDDDDEDDVIQDREAAALAIMERLRN